HSGHGGRVWRQRGGARCGRGRFLAGRQQAAASACGHYGRWWLGTATGEWLAAAPAHREVGWPAVAQSCRCIRGARTAAATCAGGSQSRQQHWGGRHINLRPDRARGTVARMATGHRAGAVQRTGPPAPALRVADATAGGGYAVARALYIPAGPAAHARGTATALFRTLALVAGPLAGVVQGAGRGTAGCGAGLCAYLARGRARCSRRGLLRTAACATRGSTMRRAPTAG